MTFYPYSSTYMYAYFDYLPMDEGAFSVHEVKLVIKTSPCFCDRGCVCRHTDSALNFSQITTRYHCWRLIVDAYLETSWTPVHKLLMMKTATKWIKLSRYENVSWNL